MSRRDFDGFSSDDGPLIVGDPEEVTHKLSLISRVLGGVSRVSLQMSIGHLSHDDVMQSIALLGQQVRLQVMFLESASSDRNDSLEQLLL